MKMRNWYSMEATSKINKESISASLPHIMIVSKKDNESIIPINTTIEVEKVKEYYDPFNYYDLFVNEDNKIFVKGEGKFLGPVFEFDALKTFENLSFSLEAEIEVPEDQIIYL